MCLFQWLLLSRTLSKGKCGDLSWHWLSIALDYLELKRLARVLSFGVLGGMRTRTLCSEHFALRTDGHFHVLGNKRIRQLWLRQPKRQLWKVGARKPDSVKRLSEGSAISVFLIPVGSHVAIYLKKIKLEADIYTLHVEFKIRFNDETFRFLC